MTAAERAQGEGQGDTVDVEGTETRVGRLDGAGWATESSDTERASVEVLKGCLIDFDPGYECTVGTGCQDALAIGYRLDGRCIHEEALLGRWRTPEEWAAAK